MRPYGGRSSNQRSSGRLDVSNSSRAYARRLSDSAESSRARTQRRSSSTGQYRGMSESPGHNYHEQSPRNRASGNQRHRYYDEDAFLTHTEHSVNNGNTSYRAASYLWENFRMPVLVAAGLVVLALALLLLFALNSGKYVRGTKIGDIDVSGMTVEQATAALNDHYIPNLEATKVYVFADEKSRNSVDADLQLLEADAQAELISFDEAKKNQKLWIASSDNLAATLPSEEIAKKVKAASDENGFFERIGLIPVDTQTPVYLSFNDGLIDDFIADIDEALGKPVYDYSLEIHDGVVYMNKGNSGKLINKDEFADSMTQLMLADQSPVVSYVAKLSKVKYDITKKMAQKTKKAIEKLTPSQVRFKSGDASMKIDKSDLMDWVKTEKEQTDNGWILKASFDSSSATPQITASLNRAKDGKFASVSISENGKDISVSTNTMIDLYDLDTALTSLEEKVFGTYNTSGKIGKAKKSVDIDLSVLSTASDFSLDEAMAHGIVVPFSSYTTKYTNTPSTQNRTNNIHLAAKTINNSIANANGGVWSYNELIGPSSEEQGYKEANVIDGNTVTSGIGGGVCQVATTAFNAVYDAGLPISERFNHALYTSSYPEGLDAAIAYPFWDFKWVNDTDSDILVVTSYTNYTVTVTLIGVDPERTIETETGKWKKGDKYKTVYEVDESLGKDESYVKQNGTDGMSITVKRTVYDSDGSVLSKDSFPSKYSPNDRIVVYGKKSDMNALKEKYEKKPKTSKKKQESENGEENVDDESQ